jgi:predicted DNA-binding transcriptional regulator AlpA
MASVAPHWPRMMRRATAALYCDLSQPEFEREVSAGRLPMPVKLGNSEHWSQAAIDEMLMLLTGDGEEDWRKGSPLYGEAA